jgi:Fur family peroxide stress response transcriptional regulator
MNGSAPAKYLGGHGIRPSYQRVSIFGYLCKKKSHPTADEIFHALEGKIPTLSKTTVYNTLELFVKKGVARRIAIDESASRFDADVSLHGHFICAGCGRIIDFKVKDGDLCPQMPEGCEVFERDVFYRGLCPECLKKSGNS